MWGCGYGPYSESKARMTDEYVGVGMGAEEYVGVGMGAEKYVGVGMGVCECILTQI